MMEEIVEDSDKEQKKEEKNNKLNPKPKKKTETDEILESKVTKIDIDFDDGDKALE